MNKREFLQKSAMLSLGMAPFLKSISSLVDKYEHIDPKDLATDEDFWAQIRSGYRLKPDYINLENGYYCFIPQETLENYIHHVRTVNYQGSYYMRTNQWANKKASADRLADMINASHDEVVITRNTTESLDTIIGGFPWNKGDEAIMAEQDYGAMRNQFKLMQRKLGIVVKEVSVPDHPKSDEEIVKLYESQITPKTKLLMICHMINITGHILPVRKICDMAHGYGVDVMVDGAHAIAHINVDVKALDCDYYGSSLHKWLSVPLGSGLLYVKKEKIEKIWPFFATWGKADDDIAKLNHTGTHPVYTDLAVINAIEYYERIGGKRKEERLRYLQRYWSDQVRKTPGINVNTPIEPHRSCGIANVGIEGMKPNDMAKTLMDKYRIWTVAINGPVYG
ncbi:MAG: aminotransferase class V-fold PLP-dependent enzyme, partial [Saprospiraceae bacterium]|nr:aminotransferase class V-fold PLP-dependent enzyme [Saprospiraceae bacterium]